LVPLESGEYFGMLKAFAGVCLFSLAIIATVGGAHAAIQAPASAAMLKADSAVERVTFWAHPYPYGYVPWHHCPRVRVETPYGWYWDRLCAQPGGVVLRRAY
jgi:hypothetical protein